MVGQGSAWDAARAHGIIGDFDARERRALDRCRRALERGRRVRGRPIASSDEHGVLLDVRGAVAHVPPADVAARPPGAGLWRGAERQWDGWVVAVHGDLVHLTATRPVLGGEESPVRSAEVLGTSRSGALARLDDGTTAVVPWDELSWEPVLAPPDLRRGMHLEGRIVGLTLDGPVLSPRAVAPSPWPAIALALPPGTEVAATLEARARGRAVLRTDRPPRAPAVVELPGHAAPGDRFAATVARVDAIGATLALEDVRPSSRGPRLVPAAPTQEPPEHPPAASGSRS